jgi:Transglutaminase-like superfamily
MGMAAIPVTDWAQILYTLVKVRWELKRRGFGPTWAQVRTNVPRPARRMPPPVVLNHAVAMVSTLLPGRVRCLEQALTSYILLRRYRSDVALRIGVTPHGFRAHAWVEVGGEPLNENADYLHTLGVFELPT